MTRGELFPFDTGVATNITQYRDESAKLRIAQKTISGYDDEVQGLYKELCQRDSLVALSKASSASKDRLISEKTATIAQLQQQFDRMQKLAIRPQRTWWVKNKLWVGLGAGLIGGYYLCSKIN